MQTTVTWKKSEGVCAKYTFSGALVRTVASPDTCEAMKQTPGVYVDLASCSTDLCTK